MRESETILFFLLQNGCRKGFGGIKGNGWFSGFTYINNKLLITSCRKIMQGSGKFVKLQFEIICLISACCEVVLKGGYFDSAF